MTDQQTPDLTALVEEFGDQLAAVTRTAWAQIKPVLDAVGLATAPADDDHDDAEAEPTASLSIVEQLLVANVVSALLAGDDDEEAAQPLQHLNAAQLYAVEAAGFGLAIHASRLRKPLVDAEWDAAANAQAEACVCTKGRSPEDYDGPQRDCPEHGERANPDMKAAWRRERDRAEQAEADRATPTASTWTP
jgi:hypothetical protein